MTPFLTALAIGTLVSLAQAVPSTSTAIPAAPGPEPIQVVELPLPPVADKTPGACTSEINPSGTGCINRAVGEFQAGDFTPDGNHVIVNVEFVGAPAGIASIYDGEHAILVKANGKTFPNGDPWKCLTCGVPAQNAQGLYPEFDYPHVFRSGTKALWGHNIIECDAKLESEQCTSENTRIYPLYWPNRADGSGIGGTPRELRIHPDDVHIGFSSFTAQGGQLSFIGRLKFNPKPTTGDPLVPRYDIVNVNILVDPKGTGRYSSSGSKLQIHADAIAVAELRGFSGAGDEVLYIAPSVEANNMDVFATHLQTGITRRLTNHPEYVDPIAFSADNQWIIIMDTRGSNRLMWSGGMRGIPPLADLVTAGALAAARNNRKRRFFQPILLDRHGDRGSYFGQRVNPNESQAGSIGDPNWNGRADPAFSPDGTKIVYWQDLVVSPACGGSNPLPCPVSTAQGRREYRLILAKLKSRSPKKPAPVFKVSDQIPWATPYNPGDAYPKPHALKAGDYTLDGKVSGSAEVSLAVDDTGRIINVVANYTNYSDYKEYIVNGSENITNTFHPDNSWINDIHWYSDLVGTGAEEATKKTTKNGFHLQIEITVNDFQADGKLITTIDGISYEPPANGT
ncbi:Hypothetical protein NCS54_00861200 [Fusarium falciforme]|uniref:Hypothetical protein n=1 Tax=Fusarium falciforme TaxID=195108 RepID=UPI0023004775|nr:Hypothetical protein NCS54_00861200 [Fusarium falciforme]WAO91157.1 Hypothetical protein NCS54_00861200 [Fusarium falciforme]